MRISKLSLLFLSAIIFLQFMIPAAPQISLQAQDEDYEALTMKLREDRCAKCHGPDSFGAAGMDYILDTAMLIENGIIKPGLPEQSELYEEVHAGKMPADDTGPLPAEDIQLIANWITSLAPEVAEMVEEEQAAATGEQTTEGEHEEGGNILKWLGNFHPVLVHFPIGLILIAGFFELLSMAGGAFPFLPMQEGHKGFSTAARLCIFFGAIFAVISGGLGWFNAMDHFFPTNLQDELFWHRWLGSTVAALSVLTLIFSEIHHRATDRGESSGSAGMLYRLFLFIACILIIIVGHLGGTLVFGEGYYNF